MKKILILLFLICSFSTYAQKRRFSYKQKIPLRYLVVDSYAVKNGDTLYLPQGSTIKEEKVIEKGGTKKTYTALNTISVSTSQFFDKAKTYERRLKGKANVYVKEDDYSKIFLDYWVTTPTYISKNHKLSYFFENELIKVEDVKTNKKLNYYSVPDSIYNNLKKLPSEINRLNNSIDSLNALKSNGNSQMNFTEAKKFFFVQKQREKEGPDLKLDDVDIPIGNFEFKRSIRKEIRKNSKALKDIYRSKENKNYLWANYAKEKVEVLNTETGQTDTLFKKYPQNAYIKLENRQYINLTFAAWEMAALTVPIKYRKGFTKNSVNLPSQASTEFNVSTYLGRTWGRLKYVNQASEKIKPHGQAFTAGVFFGFNVVELDSVSTSIRGEKALKEKQTSIALTTGLGASYNIMDFNVGVFLGVDNGFGEAGRKWNYSGRPWFGFGIGYNIAMIGKPKE